MWAFQKFRKIAFVVPSIIASKKQQQQIPSQVTAAIKTSTSRFNNNIMTTTTSLCTSNTNNENNSSSNNNEINDFDKQVNEFRATDPDLQHEAASLLKSPLVSSTKNAVQSSTTSSSTTIATKVASPHPYHFVPLKMGGRGGTHVPSSSSRQLLETEVSLQDLQTMTNKFYEYAFQDETLDKFIRSHNDPHGERFAKWIYQKLSGVPIWDEDRQTRDLTPHQIAGGRTSVVHDRTSAHVAAWYSPKRPEREVGRHFNLEECRVWMRLHFWAMRESGIVEQSPSFADYYVRFIGHFVSVYEGSATMFARESFRWSSNPENITKYINDGRVMKDVLGVKYWDAITDIPEEEANDSRWPYHVDRQ